MADLAFLFCFSMSKPLIFAVPDDPELKKWRPDLVDTIDKSIWLNPKYTPIGDKTHTDFEACFSVNEVAGPVERPYQIHYEAYLKDGTKVEGTATGFMARVIQHETDHLNGKLFIDYVPEGKLMTQQQYREMREKALQEKDNA